MSRRRWSKIAQHLPGRTDNEIKNYWRTRVQKHAKQLKCDVNSRQFKDAMKYLWMPRLMERIQASSAATATSATSPEGSTITAATAAAYPPYTAVNLCTPSYMETPENSCTTATSEFSNSFYAAQVSPGSDPSEYYPIPAGNKNFDQEYRHDQGQNGNFQECMNGSPCGYFDYGTAFQAMGHPDTGDQWLGDGVQSENLWNIGEDVNYWYNLQNSAFHP